MSGKRLNKIYKTIEDCPAEYAGQLSNRFIDIKGHTYNYLTVLYLVGFKNKRAEWLCKCNNCGNYVIVNSHNLRTGHTKSCGCLTSESLRKDKVGKQYGYLKVLRYDCSKKEMPYYIVECQNCGKVYSISGHALERQQSCGCIRSKNANIILNTLKQSTIPHISEVEIEKTFKDCTFKSPLRFDFYIPHNDIDNNQEILIEYDGEQHYHPVKFSNSTTDEEAYKNFISIQVRDWYKDYYCITHNYPLLRIKYSQKKSDDYENIFANSFIVGKAQASDDRIDTFDVIDADFVNYKEATFIIYAGISCTFKCCKDNPALCHNSPLYNQPKINCSISDLINRYDNQTISHTITFQGLECLDNLKQILWFIYYFRQAHDDMIIIWTGYTKEECEDLIYLFKNKMNFSNIIIKYGRYIPDQQPHYDPVLGVNLASDNQYAEKVS